jgi:hypothetical protein
LSTMSEFMKINLPDYALPSWQQVFNNCPASSKNIFILGARIYRYKIEKETDPVQKMAYLDTLQLIYDRRIEYFGEEGVVIGTKAMDILKYNEQEGFEKSYPLFRKSTELMGMQSEANVLIGLSETGAAMQKSGKISMLEFLENYVLLSDIIEKQKNDTRMRNRANLVYDRVESNLAEIGIQDCKEIEKVFRNRIENSPEDMNTLQTVSALLRNAGCEKDVFYKDVFLKIFAANPNPENASELSKHYVRNDDYTNAVDYYIKSYELESDTEKKAQYALQVSIIYYSRLSKYKEAAEYAILASQLKSDWADPYFALAPAYIEGHKQCATDAFDKGAIFWLATDLMERAIQVDPSSADKARSQIQEYRKFYPSKEEAFFRSIQEGASYSIGCWINRTTRARFN